MKAAGSVRRVYDLGCIVIPKEIRRTIHLKEGDILLSTGKPTLCITTLKNLEFP